MGVSLTAVAEDGNALACQDAQISIVVVVDPCHFAVLR